MGSYEQLSEEDKKRHDEFCLSIANSLREISKATEGVVNVLDATRSVFLSDDFNKSLTQVRL